MSMQEAILYLTALRIGAIEHGNAAIGTACTVYALHLPQNDIGLVGITIGFIANEGITYLFFAEDTL